MKYCLAPALLFALLLTSGASAQESARRPAKGFLKPGGLPAVSVQARPLPGNRMAVTIRFYDKAAKKFQRHTAVGSLDDVDRQVRALAEAGKIPPNVHDLITVAIARLRSRGTLTTAAPTAPARQDEVDTKEKKN